MWKCVNDQYLLIMLLWQIFFSNLMLKMQMRKGFAIYVILNLHLLEDVFRTWNCSYEFSGSRKVTNWNLKLHWKSPIIPHYNQFQLYWNASILSCITHIVPTLQIMSQFHEVTVRKIIRQSGVRYYWTAYTTPLTSFVLYVFTWNNNSDIWHSKHFIFFTWLSPRLNTHVYIEMLLP